MNTAERLRGYLAHYGKVYPRAWADAEQFHRHRANLGNWPDWCFVPMAGAAETVRQTTEAAPFPVPAVVRGYDIGVLGALIPWRLGQGIYRFDPDLLKEVWETPLDGDIPGEVLFRLPEYAVYVEAPAGTYHGQKPLLGFFAHLEWDMNRRRAELRLLLDTGDVAEMVVLPLHLGGTLEQGFREAVRHTTTLRGPLGEQGLTGLDLNREQVDAAANWLAFLAQPAVSTLLYLCSEAAEYSGPQTPARATGKKMYRPPAGTRVWTVGERMGAALRRARSAERQEGAPQGERSAPRGHVRRAHWHTFLTGPRDQERRRVLRWLPPIPVNLDTDTERPAVTHRVALERPTAARLAQQYPDLDPRACEVLAEALASGAARIERRGDVDWYMDPEFGGDTPVPSLGYDDELGLVDRRGQSGEKKS